MYGTVMKATLKPGNFEKMMQLSREEWADRGTIPGFRNALVLRDGDDVYGLIIFDDEASYRANASAPDQDKWYRRRRELMTTDPEWHDGEIIEDLPQ